MTTLVARVARERWPFSKMAVGQVIEIIGERGRRGSFVCKAKGKKFKTEKFYRGMGMDDFGYRFTRIS